ncbi:PCC domain-containing protein [Actinomadura roseirufa]|uniref:PCC domain-containing protein n=1 Tax=Actinomadura roseirufa TaxID=2094049 RepID=UPI0013F17479|nr:DUF296 domain-containing protein [Actinomadura roseirufa]
MHMIEIAGGPLVEALTAKVAELGITSGAIVSLIGAVDEFTISTMPEDDASKDIVSTYAIPAEMHGTGEIVNGVPHIHATFAVAGDRGLAGHLHEVIVGHWFARIYVIPS